MLPGLVNMGGFSQGIPVLVGYTASYSDASTTVSLTSLTGGIASAPAEGDLVVAISASYGTSNTDFSYSGYTEGGDWYRDWESTGDDGNFAIHYRVMTSSPNTTFTKMSSEHTVFIYVFRGINPTTPLDAAIAFAQSTSTNSSDPEDLKCPPIDVVTPNAVILLAMAYEDNGEPLPTVPSGYTGYLSDRSNSSSLLACYKIVSSPGTETPGVFAYTPYDEGAGEAEGWMGATVALRPL